MASPAHGGGGQREQQVPRTGLPCWGTSPTRTGQDKFRERSWGLQAAGRGPGLSWQRRQRRQHGLAWHAVPTILSALILIQQPGEVGNCYFSHFPGEGQRESCSGSHPMMYLISHCTFRCLNSHLNQEGTAFYDVGINKVWPSVSLSPSLVH